MTRVSFRSYTRSSCRIKYVSNVAVVLWESMWRQPTTVIMSTGREELLCVHSKCQQLSGPVIAALFGTGFGPKELQNSASKGLR